MATVHWRRRDVLRTLSSGAAASAFAGCAKAPADYSVKWSSGTAAAALKAPPNATDCHHHIYDARYPAASNAVLHPPDASVSDYRALQRRIGTTRSVLVQPSTYGTDNRCALDALRALGPRSRMVAVVDTSVTNAELKDFHLAGVRGIRFNLAQAGATTPEMIAPLADRVAPLGWHLQINAPAARLMEIMPILERVPAQVVFDHLAHIPEPEGTAHPLYARVQSLVDAGRAWIKLSGAYLDTKVGPPTYADSTAIARAFIAAAPERLVWGSDWPHPTEAEDRKPDDALLFDLLSVWAPDAKTQHRILVDNPAALYGFDA